MISAEFTQSLYKNLSPFSRLKRSCLKMMNWTDKVIVITGASSGIGEGTAIYFAKLGAKLFVTGRNKENLDNTIKQCTEIGLPANNIVSAVGDIIDKSFQTKLLSEVLEKFGRIDVLVNNAGMVHYGRSCNTTEEEYDEMFDANVKAHFMLSKEAAEHLKQNKEMAPYGVRVNAVNPGTIVSNISRRGQGGYHNDEEYKKYLESQAQIHPLGRVGVPEDVAAAIAFLASFISGQILFVDGARHCVSAGVTISVK